MNVLNRALRVWAQHRAFRTAFAKLARLTERELRDMGIERGDITRIADSDDVGRAFRTDVGHLFRSKSAGRSD